MAEAYDRQQSAKRLADIGDDIERAFPGAVLGNPNGKVTLVEFTDYGCTYCRASLPHVQQLIAANPELRVVVREWPIFEGSDEAARMALAAAKQGKFEAFHNAMFAQGPPTPPRVEAAARAAGLDREAARATAVSPEVDVEIAQNQGLAQQIGFTGTPSWVVGGQTMVGAIGIDGLQRAIDRAVAEDSR